MSELLVFLSETLIGSFNRKNRAIRSENLTWPYLQQYLFPDLAIIATISLPGLTPSLRQYLYPDLARFATIYSICPDLAISVHGIISTLTWQYLRQYICPDLAIFATTSLPWLGHICDNISTLTWPYLWQYLNPYLAIRGAFEIKCDWWNIMKTVACKKKYFLGFLRMDIADPNACFKALLAPLEGDGELVFDDKMLYPPPPPPQGRRSSSSPPWSAWWHIADYFLWVTENTLLRGDQTKKCIF